MDSVYLALSDRKEIVRYEKTFDEYRDLLGSYEPEYSFSFEGTYEAGAEDVEAALRNIIAEDPTLSELNDNWYEPIERMSSRFGLRRRDEYGNDEKERAVRGLAVTEDELVMDVFSFIGDAILFSDDADRISASGVFGDILDTVEVYRKNTDADPLMREYSGMQKRHYLEQFSPHGAFDDPSETELNLCRRFTDDLIKENDTDALYLKGMSSIDGNYLFPRSFRASEECLTRLFELTDDPQIACVLGGLYYDGSYGGGAPDHDKAFMMFTMGAANGITYGKLSLADMFSYGQGCPKSPDTAKKLLVSAYEEALEEFSISGKAEDFTECALRLGEAYTEGIIANQDLWEAYKYLLQAEMASRSSEYGAEDGKLAGDALAELRKALPEDRFTGYIASEFPWFIKYMMEDGSDAMLSVGGAGEDDLELTVTRTGRKAGWAKPMLMTFPEISCSILSNTLKVTAAGAESSFRDGDSGIRFDDINWIYPDKELEFLYRGQTAGRIRCREFRVYPQKTADRPSADL